MSRQSKRQPIVGRRLKDEPLPRLRSAAPYFVNTSHSTNIEGLAERIAAEFPDVIGSTRKTVEFLMAPYPRHLRHDRWSRGRSHGTTPKCVGRFASSLATDRERYTTAFHFLRLYVVRLLTSAPMEWIRTPIIHQGERNGRHLARKRCSDVLAYLRIHRSPRHRKMVASAPRRLTRA